MGKEKEIEKIDNDNIENEKKGFSYYLIYFFVLIFRSIKIIFVFIFKILQFIFKLIVGLITILLIIASIIFIGWWSSQDPSLHKDWEDTEAKLAKIDFRENSVYIEDIRNFEHISLSEYNIDYYNSEFNLDEISSIYYMVEPFSEYYGPAHTMVSFGFENGQYINISAELRKEKGENFDPLMGLMNQFEIVYIIGSDSDLLKLRSDIRKDKVRMYPINTSKEEMKNMFLSMLHRADKLSKEPEFYNTIWNTCTTNIVKHVNSLKKEKIEYIDYKIFLPAYSDEIAYKLGLIDTNLNFEDAQLYYTINKDLKLEENKDKTYSEIIRK